VLESAPALPSHVAKALPFVNDVSIVPTSGSTGRLWLTFQFAAASNGGFVARKT